MVALVYKRVRFAKGTRKNIAGYKANGFKVYFNLVGGFKYF